MLLSRKQAFLRMGAVAALLLFAYCLCFVFHPMTENALLGVSMMTLRWAVHVTLTVIWCLSIRQRILHTGIRRMLLSVGGLLLLWQLVRIVKYDYVIITEPVGRYCWYAYYIAMVLVPLIGVFVVDHIGRPEGYRSPKWMRYLFIPAAALIAMVFTNDLHQKVFVFHQGFELYNQEYGYGFMYMVVMGWFVALALFFVIGLMVKSRVPGSRRFQAMPLVIAVAAILFWAGYSLKLYTGDLTAVDSLIIIVLLETAIQSGLIPSNMHYRELFSRATIAAQIVDEGGAVRYASSSAEPLEEALRAQAVRETVDLGDVVLHAQPVRGGHVFWQDDVKAINDLAAHLREANELLEGSNDLMRAEVSLKERRLQAEEKTRLYDSVAGQIAGRLETADRLLQACRNNPEDAPALLSRLCVTGAFIKRRANLILLSEEKNALPVGELEACLRESLDNLRLCGVMTHLDFRGEGEAAAQAVVALYDLFEDAAEALAEDVTALMVTVRCEGGGICMRLQAGFREAASELPALSLPGGSVKQEAQEQDLFIEACAGKAGDGA